MSILWEGIVIGFASGVCVAGFVVLGAMHLGRAIYRDYIGARVSDEYDA